MKVPNREGCALCGATWGDYWGVVDGQRLFFCCSVCWTEFRNIVDEVKRRTGWTRVDEVKMTGDYRGRECTALSSGMSFPFFVRFDPRGEIQTFTETRERKTEHALSGTQRS